MSEFDDLLDEIKKEFPGIASRINELQSKNADHQVIIDFIRTYLNQDSIKKRRNIKVTGRYINYERRFIKSKRKP